MTFFKKHWMIFVALAAFIWAVHVAHATIAKVAGAVMAALIFMAALPFWWLLLPIYMLGYAFGFLPPGWYDWIPRSKKMTTLNTAIVQPEPTPPATPSGNPSPDYAPSSQ
jgi:hypothetical protein